MPSFEVLISGLGRGIGQRKMDIEEDDGMESFDINERDLEYALNPGFRRGLSKNQQLYGNIFIYYSILEHK